MKVSLIIPAETGKHKAWSKDITVTRATASGEGALILSKLIVHNTEVKDLTKIDNLVAKIPSTVQQIEKDKIDATFQLNGEKVDVVWNANPSLPLQIAESETKEITITVPAQTGKYVQWQGKLKITREKADESPDPELTLTKLTIANASPSNLTELDNLSVEIESNVAKVDKNNVEAEFALNGSAITDPYTLEPAELNLAEGETKLLTITVPAKSGSYKKWSHNVKVLRKKTALKRFVFEKLEIWNVDILGKDDVRVKSDAKEHNFRVSIANCDEYEVKVNIDGTISQTTGSDGIATIKDLDIPKSAGGVDAIINITANGMEPFKKRLTIERVDTDADVKVSVKFADDEDAVEVSDGATIRTLLDSVMVEVNAEAEMTEAKIAGDIVPLENLGKKAKKTVATGSVAVELKFKWNKPFVCNFTIEKVTSSTEFPVEPTSVAVFSGDNYEVKHVLKKNKNGVYTCDALDDIQYSIVKLVMNMNTKPTKAEITKCEDGRANDYATNPTNEQIGIFSGRIKAEIDGNRERTELNPIKDKTYTEYLVIGRGKVGYTFAFEADGKKSSTAKVEIENKNTILNNERVGQVVDPELGSGYYLGDSVFRWPSYRKENSDNDYEDGYKIEYMGDKVRFLIAKSVAGGNDLFVCYHLFDDRKTEKCHEFVKVQKNRQTQDKTLNILDFEFDPEAKCVDVFIADKKKLPIVIHPNFLKYKWNRVLKKGFSLGVENDLLFDSQGHSTALYNDFMSCMSLRKQTKIYQKNNELATLRKNPLKIGKNQKYKNDNGKEISGKVFLHAEKDMFVLLPTPFLPRGKDISSSGISAIKYTIKKSSDKTGNDSTWQDVDGHKDVNVEIDKMRIVILGGSSNPWPSGKFDASKVYKFVDGEVYRIEVEVTFNDSTKEYFDYQIYYTDAEQFMDNYETDGDYSGELFGLPFETSAIERSQFSELRRELAPNAIFSR